MILLMVDGTERDGKFVTDLEPKSSRLCEADVMGVAGDVPSIVELGGTSVAG